MRDINPPTTILVLRWKGQCRFAAGRRTERWIRMVTKEDSKTLSVGTLKKGTRYPLGIWISMTWRGGGSIWIMGCAKSVAELCGLVEGTGATLEPDDSVLDALGATSFEWVAFEIGSFMVDEVVMGIAGVSGT